MAEDQQGQEAPTTENDTPQEAPETGSSDSWLDTLPDEQRQYIKSLREENAQRRVSEREAKQALEAQTAAQHAAEDAKLAEQQKWQELAEKREREANQFKAELEQERISNLRTKIALELGVPPVLAARLQGATEDEIRNDAAQLLPLIQQPQSNTQQPPARSQTTSAVPDGQPTRETDQQRRARLNPKFRQPPGVFDQVDIIVNDK